MRGGGLGRDLFPSASQSSPGSLHGAPPLALLTPPKAPSKHQILRKYHRHPPTLARACWITPAAAAGAVPCAAAATANACFLALRILMDSRLH